MSQSNDKQNTSEAKNYVAYIFVTNEQGILSTKKFMNTLDVTKIKVGDTITDFYGEEYKFFNVVDNQHTLLDGKLINISDSNLKSKKILAELSGKVLEMAYGIKDVDLLENSRDDSIIEVFTKMLESRGVEIKNKSIADAPKFDVQKYLPIRNELSYRLSVLKSSESASLDCMLHVIDAFAYNNNHFKTPDGIVLYEYDEDSDDSSMSNVSYQKIINAVRYAENTASFMDFNEPVKDMGSELENILAKRKVRAKF